MIIRRTDENNKNITICTAEEFINILSDKIYNSGLLQVYHRPNNQFKNIDFAFANQYGTAEISEDVSLDDIEECSWFGIKPIIDFNSSQLDLMCDYYGGGAIHVISFVGDETYSEIRNKLINLIFDSVADILGRLNPDEYLYIENLEN